MGTRLQRKIVFTSLSFLATLAFAMALLVNYGFGQTQQNAKTQSVAGLKAQGLDALEDLIQREARMTDLYLETPARASQVAAAYLGTRVWAAGPASSSQSLVQHRDGHGYNPVPDRASDLFIPNFVELDDPLTLRAVESSAHLDALGPHLLAETSQAVALYYVSTGDVARYYPANTLEGNVPPNLKLTDEPWFAPTGPEANPERTTFWSPPYLDDAGNGLMITTCSPVYQETTFDGVVCLDVTLNELSTHLNELRMTPNSYAFLTDATGRLIAGPPEAIRDLAGVDTFPIPSDDQPVGLEVTDELIKNLLQVGAHDIHTLTIGDRESYFTSVQLGQTGWRLAVIVPIKELIAQSHPVVTAIRDGTADTVRSTIFVMIVFFMLALFGTIVFSRHLTRPIAALVASTERVARGDLHAELVIRSDDEIGKLASSFNTMTTRLRQQREESDQARLTAEQANRAKSEFLANMSHELRTPLAAILGYSDLLARQAQQGAAQNVEDIGNISRAGNHLLALINDILDLSKIEAGRMTLTPDLFSANQLLAEVVPTVQPLVEQNGNRLITRLDEREVLIYADATRVRQVLINLIGNAAKFTSDGAVTLTVRRESAHGQDYVCFDVTDTGIGIRADQLSKLFQPFSQADASTTRKYGGTGLGLALSRRLCELMNGSISVESVEGQGSTFTMWLPALTGSSSPLPEPIRAASRDLDSSPLALPSTSDWIDRLVLVIDDDPAVRDLLTRCLTERGYFVESACSGEEGEQLAKRLRPDIVILDVVLPGMSGWDLLAVLQADADLSDIPVIVLTIVDEDESQASSGVAAYLVKPIDQQKLLAAVRSSLARLPEQARVESIMA